MTATIPTNESTCHPPTFHFQLQRLDGGRLLLQLAGELDMAVRPHLHELCAAVLATKPVSVEVDLTRVTFIDLRGVRALATMQQTLRLETRTNRYVAIVRGACHDEKRVVNQPRVRACDCQCDR